MSANAIERRKIRAIVRRYERDGYRVTMPERDGRLPPFLEGFQPDLIAESEHDRVVVEVKRSDAVRGANELLEIAERIADASGWRFELVTVTPQGRGEPPTARRIGEIESRARDLAEAGQAIAAYLSVSLVLEALLEELAARSGLRVDNASLARAARDLVSRGVLTRGQLKTFQEARDFRNRLLQADREPVPTARDLEALLALMKEVYAEVAG